jgi:hypothetical protein
LDKNCVKFIESETNITIYNVVGNRINSVLCSNFEKMFKMFYEFDDDISKCTEENLNSFKYNFFIHLLFLINNNKKREVQSNKKLLINSIITHIYQDQILEKKGGNAKVKNINKKEILGKERCIYKKPGDRKEYLKHKGELITVKDYKKLMKDKK